MRRLFSFVFLFSCFFVFMTPPALAEEDTCDCWCGRKGDGAMSVQTQLASACDAACEAQGSGYEKIICTDNNRAKPPTDLTCWTDRECSEQNGVWGGSVEIGEPTPKHCYGGTPEENYCYPDPEPMPLNILIGAPGQEMAEVDDLAEYIAAWYQWMLYAGVIIAVVMIMIGGVQYMAGKGMGQIDAAKKRIQSAIIGLVILFGAYIILSTVNPQLVLLQIPKYPLIKQVVYVDDSVRCEKLYELGYTLEYNNRVITANSLGSDYDCGEKADVVLDPNGDTSDVEFCYWSKCPDGENCLVPQSTDPNVEDVPECMSCTTLSEDNDENVPPSSTVCDPLSLPTITTAKGFKTYNTCYYTGSTDIVGILDAFGNKAGSCVMVTIDCENVNNCDDYEERIVTYGDNEKATLKDTPFPFGNYSLYDACTDNPCKDASKKHLQDGCALITDRDLFSNFNINQGVILLLQGATDFSTDIFAADFECVVDEGQEDIVNW